MCVHASTCFPGLVVSWGEACSTSVLPQSTSQPLVNLGLSPGWQYVRRSPCDAGQQETTTVLVSGVAPSQNNLRSGGLYRPQHLSDVMFCYFSVPLCLHNTHL